MKNIIVIEATITGAGFFVFDSAKKLHVQVTFLCNKLLDYLPCGIQKYIDQGMKVIEVDTSSYESVHKVLIGEFNKKSLDGVICLNDRCIEIAAKLAETYNLPFINHDAVAICRNKNLTAIHCSKINIRTPKTWIVNSLDDFQQLDQLLDYPIVLKSSRGTGSGEVLLCHNHTEAQLNFTLMHSKALAMQGQLMVQEYIKGPLVSVEAFTYQGNTKVLGITDRILGTVPYFVEVADTFSVYLGESIDQKLSEDVSRLLKSLNVQYGVTHTEFIVAKEGPVLIEVNPRLAGGLIGRMISHAYDADLYQEIIRLSLGEKPELPDRPVRAMTEYFLYPNQSGVISDIQGIDIVKNYPGVVEVIQNVEIGEYVSPPQDYSGKIIATIISQGDTSAHSLVNCFAALSNIVVCYQK